MPMGKIHLFRHAEGLHNIFNDTSLHDPSLSERGFYHAENLGNQFAESNSDTVGIVITSPLRRTIQTSLAAFPRVLDKRYYPVGSGRGGAPSEVWEGAKLVLDPDLQEIDVAPANTGSDSQTLRVLFPEIDYTSLPAKWYVKEGDWSPDQDAVSKRVVRIMRDLEARLGSLRGTRRPDVVVVTHGGIIAKLVPGLAMPLASWKSFMLEKRSNGELYLSAV